MSRQVVLAPRHGVHFDAPPPLSLYVHVPWCVRKCPYCDFNSHELRGELQELQWLDALEAELQAALPGVWGRRIETVFFGGGTPSLLSGATIARALNLLRTLLPFHPDAEITLEANPGTVEAQRFAEYRAAGVNRLSLGVQSFNPKHLTALGRIHDDAEARRAVDLALQVFERVNVDLMYGLPGQSAAQALADVRTALDCGISHLSCYQLTLEPNTSFHSAPPKDLPDADSAAGYGEAVAAEISAAGLAQYETSAFARPGQACRHNLNYWTFGDYLGLGPGAHGKLSYQTEVVREARLRYPRAWMTALSEGQSSLQLREAVPPAELPFEFAMNAFRLVDGVPIDLFSRRTGLPLSRLLGTVDGLVERGLLDRGPGWLKPTPLGMRFLNDLLQAFLPAT